MNMTEEVKCGFLVTAEQKHINAVYLDLIQEFGRLCRRAGVQWWRIFGGLIGAVRHQGFIPWDDDIDILVPRKDYDRLWHMTNEQFGAEGPYFLQNPTTDPSYVQFHMRFRRSDTTCIMDYDLKYLRAHPDREPYNMGINLSLFPLDNYPAGPLTAYVRNKLAYIFWGMDYRAGQPSTDKPLFHWLCKTVRSWIGRPRLVRLMHKYLTWPREGDIMQCMYGFYHGEEDLWPRTCFAETVYLPFEDIQVPAPVGYDDILRATYGDYMQFPPEEQRTAKHGGIMRWDIPYPEAARILRSGGSVLPESSKTAGHNMG